uniref:Uncharacterized protein n=1 Tax=Electrophorus electricus TaxID=8005 RepID=A0A4W4FHR8_ELEEL
TICAVLFRFCFAAGTLALAHGTLLTRGFTSAGIAASSAGAGMMSSAAIANGGGVAASGLVALLQSAGGAMLTVVVIVELQSVSCRKKNFHRFHLMMMSMYIS